jgi:osmotically-inducible protein OsmY
MRIPMIMALAGTLALGACSDASEKSDVDRSASATDTAPSAPDVAAEERGGRDLAGGSDAGRVTAQDQSDTEADREMTRGIREQLSSDEGLSMAARNVTIVTSDGVVTLAGQVGAEEERTRIAAIAKQAPGVKEVINQVEVAQ